MENATLKLVIFSFILSTLFPVLAYTFTSFGIDTPNQFDITLNTTQLENNNVILIDGVSNNVTFAGAPVEYTVNLKTIRIAWVNEFLTPDYLYHYRQAWIHQQLGTWLFPSGLKPTVAASVGTLEIRNGLTNATILNAYDPSKGWMEYELHEVGLSCFVSPLPIDGNNLTESMRTGTISITVGARAVNSTQTFNPQFQDFVNDYLRVISGQDSSWGMPAFMEWTIRIFSFLTLLSALLLAKEFIPFL